MKYKHALNVGLAMVVCLEVVFFVGPSKKMAEEIIVSLSSSFENLPQQKNDIEINGIGTEFCLFNETENLSSAFKKVVTFRSTPIQIKNNSAQPICLQIKGFASNDPEYSIVNKDKLYWPGQNLSLGVEQADLKVAWFKPDNSQWVCNLAEFHEKYPVVPSLAGGESSGFYIVGAYCGECLPVDDVNISVILEIEEQADGFDCLSSSIAGLSCGSKNEANEDSLPEENDSQNEQKEKDEETLLVPAECPNKESKPDMPENTPADEEERTEKTKEPLDLQEHNEQEQNSDCGTSQPDIENQNKEEQETASEQVDSGAKQLVAQA